MYVFDIIPIHSLTLFDRGGQSMNSKNLPQYLSSSQIIFIVYDVTNPESFANVDDWLRLVTSYAPTAKVHLVGNKVGVLMKLSLMVSSG
jgi:GTPase SAR1 family protein